MPDIAIFSPLPFLLALVSILSLMIGIFFPKKILEKFDPNTPYHIVSFLTLLTFSVVLFNLIKYPYAKEVHSQIQYNFLMLTFLSYIATMLLMPFLNKKDFITAFEYPLLILLSALGAWYALVASNLLTLYIGIEIQSLCFYILVAFQKEEAKSLEAGIKYFIIGALSSCLLLFGIALVYGFFGTIDLSQLHQIASADILRLHGQNFSLIGLFIGCLFIIVALGFKISAVPFHMWTPDVYEGSPLTTTLLLSTVSKVVGFGVLVKIVYNFPFIHQYQVSSFFLFHNSFSSVVFVTLGVLSSALGALAALKQTSIRRFIAYSSIAHVGFLLLIFSIGPIVIQVFFIYLLVYIITMFGIFGCLAHLSYQRFVPEKLSDISGVGKTHPLLGFIFSMLIFSLAGIPPLAGFFAKLFMFQTMITYQAYALTIVSVLLTVLGAVYYLRVVSIIYFDAPNKKLTAPENKILTVFVIAAAIFVILFFISTIFFQNIFTNVSVY